MAISDTQKIDDLYKKLVFGVTKTDVAGNKSPSNEAIPSPLLVRGDTLWNESGAIPAVPPTSTTDIVRVRTGTATVAPTSDPTVVPATRTWITGIENWIPPQFGSAYTVKVYADGINAPNPQLTGTLLAPDGINNDAWIFDYQAGVLNFADTNIPAALTGKTLYIAGYEYVGSIGIGAGSSYGNLTIVGSTISTSITDGDVTIEGNGAGGVVLNDQTTINGATTVNGAITSTTSVSAPAISGNITSTGTSTFATVDVNGGAIDGTVIGATTPAAATFTTVTGGAATFSSINNTPIGNAVPSTGAFTTLASSGLTSITDTTQSTLANNGALVVAGGVGIGMNLNVDGSVIVTGDLTVQGTTTTVNSTEVSVADKNITVASGATNGAEADGAGLTVAGAGATIVYNGSTDTWNLNKDLNAPVINSTSTIDSTSPLTGALTTDGGAGVAKDLYVGGTIHGAVQTANLTATGGTVSVTSVSASVVTTANAQVSGGAISNTPISGSTGSFTTMTTPNAQVTGGAISGVTVDATSLTTSAATITGGTLDGVTVSNSAINTSSVSTSLLTATGGTIDGVAITDSPISGAAGTFTTMTTNDAQIGGGVITGVEVTATKVTTANAQVTGGAITATPISGSTGSFTTLTTANAQVTGGSVTGLTVLTSTNGTVTNLSSGNATITGGNITATPISGSTGSFTNLTAASFTADSINNTPIGNTAPSTAAFTTLSASGLTHITDTTQSTATDNGALVVDGGVGIGKNLNVGGNAIITGNLTVNGSTTIVNSSDLSTTDRNITLAVGAVDNASADGAGITVAGSGAEVRYDGSNDSWNLNKTVNAPTINSTATVDSTSPATGSLTTDGGAGVAKDLWVGGTIHGAIQTANIQATGGSLTGLTDVASTAGSFTNLTSGNATITGGAISGVLVSSANATITGGSITGTPVSGSTGSFTTLATSGEATLNSVVTANAQISGGAITGTPFSGSTVNATSVTTADAQITGGAITSTPVSGSTVDATVLTTANAQISGGAITSTPISGSTGSFTTVSASAGITGTLQTAAQPNVTSVGTLTGLAVSGNASVTDTATVGTLVTGNAQITGGAITGTPISGSTGAFTNLTAASFTADSINNTPVGNAIPSTGAFTTLAANGLAVITDTTQSTAVTNGALVVAGGVGIGKNLNVGGDAVISGNLSVLGTTTTINSSTVDTADKNITIAKGATGSASQDGAGITVDGPLGATITYVDSTDTWNFNKNLVAGTFNGNVNATNIAGTLTTAAQPNVTTVGSLTNLVVVGDTSTGTLTTAGADITGGTISGVAITASTGDFTTLSTPAATITGGTVDGVAITDSTGEFTTLSSTTSFNATGAVTISGSGDGSGNTIDNVNIGSSTAGTGTFTTLAAEGFTSNVITANTINGVAGSITTLTATDINAGSLTVTGTSELTDVIISTTLAANGTSAFNGNATFYDQVQIAGALNASSTATFGDTVTFYSNVNLNPSTGLVVINPTQTGSINNMTIVAPSLTTGNAQITGGVISGTPISGSTGSFTTLSAASFIADSINNTPIGNAVPSTGAFTTLAATSGILGVLQTNAQPNINSVGTLTTLDVTGTATVGALSTASVNIDGGTIDGTVIGSVVPAAGTFTTMTATNIAGTLTTAAQPNVTSVGTLTTLAVSGVTTTGDLTSSSVSTANAIVSGGSITSTPISGSTGSFTTMTTANAQVTGGSISNTPISGSTGGFTTLTANNGTVTNLTTGNAQITGGNVSGVAIVSSTGSFTTLSGIDTTATNFATANAQITGGAITSTPISGSTGSFTTLTAGATTVTGAFNANANIESTSTTTGTIIVTGGVGISGNINVGNGAHINSNNSLTDTVISGSTDASLIYANSATNQVMIGGNIVSGGSFIEGAKLQVISTDSMILPAGTSGQRPVAPVVGMVRFNSTFNQLEFWNGSIWSSTETVFTLITDQQFTGDNLTDTFFLNEPSTTNSTIVSINGVVQIPGLAYSVAGSTLQFSEPPLSTDVIDVRVLVTTQAISGLASPNGFNQIIPDDTELSVWTGITSSTKKWVFDGATGALLPIGPMDIGSTLAPVDNIFASNVVITGGTIKGVSFTLDAIDDTVIGANVSAPGSFTGLIANAEFALQQGAAVTYNEVGTSFDTSPTVVDSFDATLFRTAKYVVSVTRGSVFQAAEVLVTHDGTNAYSTTYGVVSSSGSAIATFTANISGGMVTLQATGTAAGNEAKVQKTYIAIPASLPGVGGAGAGSAIGIAPGTYATLDENGKVPVSELPAIAISNTFVVASSAAMTALTAETGDIAVRTDLNKSFILTSLPASTLGNWQELLTPTASASVTSVNGQTGIVTITNITGNAATATYATSAGTATTADSATTATTASTAVTVTAAAQPAITSVGTLTGLTVSSAINGSITGNAVTANSLTTARNIALTGDVTGTVSFNGSTDVSIATTLKGDVVSTKTFTGAVTCNYATEGSYVAATVTGATTLTITGVPDSTRAYGMTFELTNAGTNVTWPASVTWLGTAPTLRASGVSMVTLVTRNGGTTWYGSAA